MVRIRTKKIVGRGLAKGALAGGFLAIVAGGPIIGPVVATIPLGAAVIGKKLRVKGTVKKRKKRKKRKG